ncbi:bifunctional AP-4-A phosphorylase/ADP sulfurylase [Apophysomyces ossiformis]|uniref:Bifunctional AP-4-A phosphorylase/ADP sulfurylase n=1 Tax=Apophysomyces ossiformis TaxID=679940 RepID=A0A8H7ETH4_9FUNG|nr:bifunctional AP-4-A phosphorylase/ADP sulfurylase [Apophysomyces ossiformis]
MTDLAELVEQRFNEALASGNLLYFPGSISKKDVQGMQFEITFVPSLAKKPVSKSDDNPVKAEKRNPFLPPDPALVVKELEEHRILLNKFSVVPHHILIVTKEFKDQGQPLYPADLYVTWENMVAMGPAALGFYNCGPNSGASQPHKHIQIIPLHIKDGAQPPITALYNEINNPKPSEVYTLHKLPYVHAIMPLDTKFLEEKKDQQEAVMEYLHQMYFGLLDAMFQQIRENTSQTKLSYNFIMTREYMFLVPRSKEIAVLEHDGQQVEHSINCLGYAGMMLAKTEQERAAIEQHPDLFALLATAGIPWAPTE